MKALEITRLLDSHEPLAIVRYFEWVALAKDNGTPRYALLHLNKKKIKYGNCPYPIPWSPCSPPACTSLPKYAPQTGAPCGSVCTSAMW